jgi:hypothetical protein
MMRLNGSYKGVGDPLIRGSWVHGRSKEARGQIRWVGFQEVLLDAWIGDTEKN